jgi:hypothetical protein
MSGMFRRGRIWIVLASSGAGLMAFDSCDASVRDTVVIGFGTAASSLTTALIQAAVQPLAKDDESDTTLPTVRNADSVPRLFA